MTIQTCDNCLMCSKDLNFRRIKSKCNYCIEGENRLKSFTIASTKADFLPQKSDKLLLGLSGGVDSTYLVHSYYKNGQRPEVLHVDLGWNSSIANKNIELLCEYYQIDLAVKVIDWEAYREAMCAFIDTDIIDIELLYDNLVFSSMYEHALETKKKVIISGFNSSTECVAKPENWGRYKYDKLYIKEILRFNKIKGMEKLNFIGTLDKLIYRYVHGIKWNNTGLDNINYNRANAITEMSDEFGFLNYGQKHTENYFTNFYQNIILTQKFQIEKIRLHLSSEIVSSSISKVDALEELNNWRDTNSHINQELLTLICNKLRITEDKMMEYLKTPPKDNFFFSEKVVNDFLLFIFRLRTRLSK